MDIRSSYLYEVFAAQSAIIARTREQLKDIEYDTMVGRGMSGAMVIPLLAYALNKQFAIVRKPEDSSHGMPVEGAIAKRWIFVDDFISTGNTLRETYRAYSRFVHANTLEESPVFVGAWQYAFITWVTEEDCIRNYGLTR